jgi:hypothetical protein
MHCERAVDVTDFIFADLDMMDSKTLHSKLKDMNFEAQDIKGLVVNIPYVSTSLYSRKDDFVQEIKNRGSQIPIKGLKICNKPDNGEEWILSYKSPKRATLKDAVQSVFYDALTIRQFMTRHNSPYKYMLDIVY